jgi:hypothetical protein
LFLALRLPVGCESLLKRGSPSQSSVFLRSSSFSSSSLFAFLSLGSPLFLRLVLHPLLSTSCTLNRRVISSSGGPFVSHLLISNHDSTSSFSDPMVGSSSSRVGRLLSSGFLKSMVIDVESLLNAGPYVPRQHLRLFFVASLYFGLHLFSCVFALVGKFVVSGSATAGHHHFELRFLSFRSTGSADLALKGRILSRDPRPKRHYIF